MCLSSTPWWLQETRADSQPECHRFLHLFVSGLELKFVNLHLTGSFGYRGLQWLCMVNAHEMRTAIALIAIGLFYLHTILCNALYTRCFIKRTPFSFFHD